MIAKVSIFNVKTCRYNLIGLSAHPIRPIDSEAGLIRTVSITSLIDEDRSNGDKFLTSDVIRC